MNLYAKVIHSKHDLKVHLVWIPKYRKKIVFGEVALWVRDLLGQVAMERDLVIISGKIARDHLHMFLSYGSQQDISSIVQWLKGTNSPLLLQEFAQISCGKDISWAVDT